INSNTDGNSADEDNQVSGQSLTLDTPAAFAPVTDTESIDEATVVANYHQSHYSVYHALAHATDLNIADTFILVDHNHLNQHYRATHIVHLARNSLAHVTGLTISRRHHERHASTLEAGIHLTQLRLITADTPWVGSLYSKRVLPPMTGITDDPSDTDSRNHMTPTKSYLLDSPAQPINRLEAQAGANYGSHFTHRSDDQTLMQSIGDGEHLINTGSLLSSTRPSLFTTDNEQAIESGYRNTGNGLSEWITDHRDEQAYSQLNVDDGQVAAMLKMGVINAESDGASSKRQGINANTSAQINIKSGEALVFSTQPQTHAQSGQHNYQQHTPTLTQTALGGQHLAERLTQLATGLGRQVNDHKAIKTQLESIAEEQQSKTHQQAPYTLIDGAADTSYVSDETLIQRSMGEMITTTQQDMMVSSGDGHHQVSSESLTMVADG
ncbi:type VI secretion system Vgr family protein, partial [Psychrobacter sp. AOP7-C1-12]